MSTKIATKLKNLVEETERKAEVQEEKGNITDQKAFKYGYLQAGILNIIEELENRKIVIKEAGSGNDD